MKSGDFSRVSIKDKVLTIGYPPVKIMGVRLKYTEGVISAVNEIKDNPVVFQTTVPIQPGNSGINNGIVATSCNRIYGCSSTKC